LQSRIDKQLKLLQKAHERTRYADAVMKMFKDYEETVFNLSEQSANETIASIKAMSLGQRLQLQELITKRNQRLKKGNEQRV
jgi:ABC-type Na+ transport system ATPase subunit NatA